MSQSTATTDMTLSRPEYPELELPRVETGRSVRGNARTVRVLIVLAALAAVGVIWRGKLQQGVVFAREWLDGRISSAGTKGAGKSVDTTRLLFHTAQPIDLKVTALVSGTLESASSATVLSEVEGENAILSVVPEGTRVAAGDVVVELDSSGLRARLTEQQIVVENARASVGQLEQANKIATSQADGNIAAARLVVEFARLDLQKYEKGDYPLALRGLQIETALAQEELERARVQLQFSEDLAKDGYIHQGELEADRSRVTQANFKVENAHSKERSLQDYTYPRTKRDLESKVQEAERTLARVETQERLTAEQAESNLIAKKKTLELEEGKLTKINDQLGKCAIRAPQAGMVVYPVPPDADMVEDFIKQGNRIKQRKHVFSIPDTDVLQVSTMAHEAIVNKIRPGLTAVIKIDSIPDIELTGTVEWVSPTPDPGDWRRTTVKFYETRVRIDSAAGDLRPGMSAKAWILIEVRPNALVVPVQSVVQRGSKGVCYVLAAGPELRHVRLGKSNAEYVEVLEGLSAGERVVMSPDLLGIPADAFEEAPAPDASAAPLTAEVPPAPTGLEPAPAGTEDPAAAGVVQELEYEAELAGVPVTKAEAEFKIKTKNSVPAYKFKVEIIGGPPGVAYGIKVDGVPVGSVTLDDTGSCALELSTKLGNFPPDFPLQARDGSIVELGEDLKGTLALSPP